MIVARMLELERAAFGRLWERRGPLALGTAVAGTGALGVLTAMVRLRFVFHVGELHRIGQALGAAGLGLDLFLVTTLMGLGLAISAIATARTGFALALPAARISGGLASIAMLAFVVAYAVLLGYARIGPDLVERAGPLWARAATLTFALAPSALLLAILGAATLVAIALVGRGVPPGRAVATGFDHVLRRPAQALSLFALHGLIGSAFAFFALTVAHGSGIVAIAPVYVLVMAWTVAAFDAALGADARLISG